MSLRAGKGCASASSGAMCLLVNKSAFDGVWMAW